MYTLCHILSKLRSILGIDVYIIFSHAHIASYIVLSTETYTCPSITSVYESEETKYDIITRYGRFVEPRSRASFCR